MLQEFSSCRDILQAQFDRRRERNGAYSLRAFARDLDLSPSRVSEVLNEKGSRISAASAAKIAAKLALSDEDRQYFIDLSTWESSQSDLRRQIAQARIATYLRQRQMNTIDHNDFQFISNWYHLAIVELVKLPDFQPDARWIACRLQLNEDQVIQAFANLEKAGLISFDEDELLVIRRANHVASQQSSAEIREFHHQMLDKAKAAVDQQDTEDRDLGALILAFASSNSSEIKELLTKLKRAFRDEAMAMTGAPDSLYALCVQWIRLDSDEEAGPSPKSLSPWTS